ncbi:PKD domain-containing protein [Limnovirga soli]|uniref:PKD domain-containing protein n=1 Tax=Limnovirga soli TaxID=2656915 RepID=A0A8J8JVB2_9BACT|nr:PKD domain-containing protein [Limnovirga soli]NNV54021.1 hypothetical protein [Limnovirga soli]
MRKISALSNYTVLGFLMLLICIGNVACDSAAEKERELAMKKRGITEEEENNGKYDKAAALKDMFKQWDDMQRDPVTGTVPVERLTAAYQRTKQLLNRSAISSFTNGVAGVSWVNRGPNNVGGRTRAIMISPLDATGNTGFAGGVGGGLWKSTNLKSATPTWSAINDFLPNLAITYITYSPANTSIFYAATGEGFGNADAARGLGILKSTDGGTTWSFLSATNNSNYYFVNKVLVNSNGDLYAATSQGLFRSQNAGASFTQVIAGNVSDVEIASNGVIYAGKQGSNSSLFRSTNGDAGSWTDLILAKIGLDSNTNKTQRVEAAVSPSDPNTVYAMLYQDTTSYTQGGSSYTSKVAIYSSTDGGASFTRGSSPNDEDTGIPDPDFTRSQGWYDLILAVDPDRSNVIYAGGIDIFKSDNYGQSWVQLTHWYGGFSKQYAHADQHGMTFEGKKSDIMYFTNDGGIFQTTNAKDDMPSIKAINTNYIVTQFYACDYNPTKGSNYFLAGAQDNGTQQFTTAGVGATQAATGGDGAYCNIDKVDPTYQFTQYVYNNYYRSTDGGASFNTVSSGGLANTGRFINPSDYDGTTKTLFAATNTGKYLRWVNATTSSTFQSVSVTAITSTISAVTVSKAVAGKVYFGLGNGKIISVNKAATVTGTAPSKNLGTPVSNGYVNAIWENPTDSTNLIAIYSNYGVTNIWETKNAGAATPTWTAKDGDLADMPVYCVLPDPTNPANNVLIGTELGVYSTSNFQDANPNWVPTSANMAYTRITQLKLRSSDSLVLASTHGRGLFTSDVFMSAAANFTASKIVTYVNKPVSFSDASTKASSWQWDYSNDGSYESTAQNPTTSFSTAGVYTVRLRINGSAALEKTITVTVLPNKATPYALADGGDFDSNPNDFAADNIGTSAFSRGNSVQAGKNGTHSGSFAWVIDINSAQYTPNSTAYLYSPNYNCTAPGTYTVNLYAKYKIENTWDGFRVEYSTDKGDTWLPLGTTVQTNWYDYDNPLTDRPFPVGEAYFSNVNKTSYTLCTYSTSDFAGNENVAFRVVFQSDPASVDAGLAVDDFSLDGPPNALPVNLISFTAFNSGDKNTLQWKSGSEINSNRYELERSFDGRNFEKFASVASKNNPTGATYTYSDNIALVKINTFYYRIKMVDNDGSFKYSQVINLKLSGRVERISVLGNITNGPVKILVPASMLVKPIQANIISNSGAVVKRTIVNNMSSIIDIRSLAAGSYYMNFIQDGKLIQTEKIIKQ